MTKKTDSTLIQIISIPRFMLGHILLATTLLLTVIAQEIGHTAAWLLDHEKFWHNYNEALKSATKDIDTSAIEEE